MTAGPVWDQIVEFIQSLPGMWEDLQDGGLVRVGDGHRRLQRQGRREWLAELVKNIPDAATALLGAAGGVFGSLLSLVTLTFLALFLLMERPTITDWLFGFARPETERAGIRWWRTRSGRSPRR